MPKKRKLKYIYMIIHIVDYELESKTTIKKRELVNQQIWHLMENCCRYYEGRGQRWKARENYEINERDWIDDKIVLCLGFGHTITILRNIDFKKLENNSD
jgi:hypothetical protein